jgi:hypothetical protein
VLTPISWSTSFCVYNSLSVQTSHKFPNVTS